MNVALFKIVSAEIVLRCSDFPFVLASNCVALRSEGLNQSSPDEVNHFSRFPKQIFRITLSGRRAIQYALYDVAWAFFNLPPLSLYSRFKSPFLKFFILPSPFSTRGIRPPLSIKGCAPKDFVVRPCNANVAWTARRSLDYLRNAVDELFMMASESLMAPFKE